MMKHLKFLFLFIFSVSLHGYAQGDTAFALVTTIRGDIQQFAVDNLDNLYLVSSTGQLKKLDAKGDSVAVFNDVKRFGKLSTIDVSNPLKVLLYYKDFSTIVILDRLLNVRHIIDLRKNNLFQVSAIGQSYDGKVWLYDEMNSRLKKIDEEGKLLLETADLRQVFDPAPQPHRIFDQDGFVYLYDSTKGFFVFDYYGAFKNQLPYAGWRNITIAGPGILATKDNRLQRYQFKTFAWREELLPSGFLPYQQLQFTASRIYAHTPNQVIIYKQPE